VRYVAVTTMHLVLMVESAGVQNRLILAELGFWDVLWLYIVTPWRIRMQNSHIRPNFHGQPFFYPLPGSICVASNKVKQTSGP